MPVFGVGGHHAFEQKTPPDGGVVYRGVLIEKPSF
jgi:hypothetical protein